MTFKWVLYYVSADHPSKRQFRCSGPVNDSRSIRWICFSLSLCVEFDLISPRLGDFCFPMVFIHVSSAFSMVSLFLIACSHFLRLVYLRIPGDVFDLILPLDRGRCGAPCDSEVLITRAFVIHTLNEKKRTWSETATTLPTSSLDLMNGDSAN